MKNWKSKLQNIFERVEDWTDEVKYRFKNFDDYDSLLITPYFGFGNDEKVFLKGRIIEEKKNLRESNITDSRWRNLKNIYRQFETDEVPNARIKAIFQGIETETVTDREGYFDFEIDFVKEFSVEKLWNEINLELLSPFDEDGETKAVGQILIPPKTAKFGIISDIDDTIIKTNVNNKFKMILTTILSNEHTRVPFEGVAAFYQALQKGVSGNENNPIFYVSSSPYNLFNLLIKFFELQEIPLGPIFLKDFGTHTPFTSGEHKTHKFENINKVLETYPQMPFILIGDDSEQDPEIYRQIVHEFPNRIRTIYIRKVNDKFENETDVQKLIKEVQTKNCQLVFAPDSLFAATHAAAENLIAVESLDKIRENKELDKDSVKTENVSEANLLK